MTICERGRNVTGSDMASSAIPCRKIAIPGKILTKTTSKLAVYDGKKKVNGIKDASPMLMTTGV